MPFTNYKSSNLAEWHLKVWISASAVSMILETWEWDLFPNTFPYLLLLTKYDSSSSLENKPALKREFVLVTGKAWDTFTITRSAWYVPASTWATTQTNTAFEFASWDSVSLTNSAEQQKDIDDELLRLENDKLDISDYISWAKLFAESLTGNDSYQATFSDITSYSQIDGQILRVKADVNNTWAATFEVNALWAKSITKRWGDPLTNDDVIANQIMLLVWNNNEDRFELKDTIDQRDSALAESLVDIDTHILWENVTAGDSLFVEDDVEFADTDLNTQINDTEVFAWSSTPTTNTQNWIRFQARNKIKITSVTKNASCTATRAIIKTDIWNTTIATATFVWNVATFASEVIFKPWMFFRVECDNSGWNYNLRLLWITPALTKTNVIFVTGSQAWADTSSWANIETITSSVETVEYIWDTVDNTRVAIPIFWNWVLDDELELSLRKYTSPWVNLWVRIETDSNWPTWVLADPNATSTVLESGLTTSLVDTVVTLLGNITLVKWTRYWIVLFAWTYGAETINATNYFGVGFSAKNTTTRNYMRYNGSSWVNYDYITPINDTDNLTFSSTNASANTRWYRMQAVADLVLLSINKSSTSTATRVLVKDDAGTILDTVAFSWNIATLSTPRRFTTGEYFRLECDSSGGSYTSHRLLSATFPQNRTNVNYIQGSENGANSTTAYNIDSVDTQLEVVADKFFYATSNLFTQKLLSLTNATYDYKLPTDLPRIATETKSAGENCITTTFWLNNNFSGLTPNVDMYLADTPWAISSTPWTNNYQIGKAIDANKLFVGTRQESKSFNILRNHWTATWVVTYTHNLGKIPTSISFAGGIIWWWYVVNWHFDWTNQNCVTWFNNLAEQSTTAAIISYDWWWLRQTGIVQNVTNTTFDISWTRNSTGSLDARFNVIVRV